MTRNHALAFIRDYLVAKKLPYSEERVESIFTRLDINGDGILEPAELLEQYRHTFGQKQLEKEQQALDEKKTSLLITQVLPSLRSYYVAVQTPCDVRPASFLLAIAGPQAGSFGGY